MIPLAHAYPYAERIAGELLHFCDQLAIAGSIRRQRPYVNDIDLVLLPKAGQLPDLKRRCQLNCDVVADGPATYILRTKPNLGRIAMQIDLFFAEPAQQDLLSRTPTNFGSVLLCRTGSKEHNIYLIERAKLAGLTWNPQRGVFDAAGALLASATEHDIFAALGLDFISPERRER